jgi:haloacetate dehalogenase
MGEGNFADFRRAIHDQATVHAMLEGLPGRAGSCREHDDAESATENKIGCPTLALWATRDDLDDLYGDVLGVWLEWAHNVRGRRIDSGHHMAEEAPEALAGELIRFFAR